ncbi:MAG: helix-turn-helix domain-containing protein [Puniceicoccales bacterium]|nr:helix-turn-helix domain-containing protein [Puniceicoccales bacterium]
MSEPPPKHPAKSTARETTIISARRTAARISQAELAGKCGVTRQFVNLIESGRTQPNVAVALKMASALSTTVETLFSIYHPNTSEEISVRLASPGLHTGARLNLVCIGRKWTAYAADTMATLGGGFGEADAVLLEHKDGEELSRARMAGGRTLSEASGNVAFAGCDPALALLTGSRVAPGLAGRCFWVNCGSGQALRLLAQQQAHIAGIHVGDDAGADNMSEINRMDPSGRWQLLRFTCWEQGWMLRPGTRKQFTGTDALLTGQLRLANRETGAGSRRWLDRQLELAGVPGNRLPGYAKEFKSHWECACALLSEEADIAVGPRAVAAIAGLDFISTGDVAFDLVVPRNLLTLPKVAAVLEALRGQRLRDEIESLPGYRASEAGLPIARRS